MGTVITDPFPHMITDGLWEPGLLQRVADEFPAVDHPGWRRYDDAQERKLEGPPSMWGSATFEFFGLIQRMAPQLGQDFGIPGLTMETIGGGYHLIEPGGFLKVHTDFNRSPKTSLYRRLNFLVYLNHDWNEPGGCLQLGADPGYIVEPQFNRTVVFETSDCSWHGHPVPTTRYRRSVAAYFFTAERPPGYDDNHSTVWLK